MGCSGNPTVFEKKIFVFFFSLSLGNKAIPAKHNPQTMYKLPTTITFLESPLFTVTEVAYLQRQFESLTLQKGQLLVREGEVSNKIYFIETGMLREFYQLTDTDTDTDMTTWLLEEGNWACNIESYITQRPSKCSIEALEKTRVLCIKKTAIEQLLKELPQLGLFLASLYENYLLKVDQLNTLFRIRNAEKRFLLFEANNQHLVGRVKQKHLASLLGITPSQLSRIRAKNSKK